MAMVDDGLSRLNPNAPVFIPNAAFGEVEDFSPEWWDLVKTSPRFREYWLRLHQEDDFIGSVDDYDYLELEESPDLDADQFVESKDPKKETEPVNGNGVEMKGKLLLKELKLLLNVSEASKVKETKFPIGPAKYCEKKQVNKCVSPKYSWRIHQPR